MTISEETLMAFADGELQGGAREAVESAIAADPELQHRLARHRALRTRLQQAFADDLTEPAPDRLITAARQRSAPTTATLTNLQDARHAAAQRTAGGLARHWWRAGSIAASLLMGFGLGYLVLHTASASMLREKGGVLVATGSLADVLSHRLGVDQSADSKVRVGVSFLAKSGEYCRAFSTTGEQAASGLACRAGSVWEIQALLRFTGDLQSSEFRTASSSISPLIMQIVDQQIVGEPFDQRAEVAAKQRDWRAESR